MNKIQNPTVTTTVANIYELQSARMLHAFSAYGQRGRLRTEQDSKGITDCDHFAKRVLVALRQAVKEHSVKSIETEAGTKKAKEFDTKQRVSGKKIVSITYGTKEQWLLTDSCPQGVKDITRQDQALRELENCGAGLDPHWVTDSHSEKWLAALLQEFKGSRPQTYGADAIQEKATSEEVALSGE